VTRRSRLVTGAAIAACALLVIVLAREIPSRRVRGDPGPQAFPLVTSLVILTAVAAAVIGDARRTAQDPAQWRQALVVAAATAAYVLLLSALGFVLATALFLIAASWYLDTSRRLSAVSRLVTGVAISLTLWLIFGRLVDVVLPGGGVGL
jgi:hypothetical protein